MKRFNGIWLAFAMLGLLLISCEDFLTIRPTSALSEEEVFNDYTRAREALHNCYRGISSDPFISLDYYTDNCVQNNDIKRQALGGMTAENSPVSNFWTNSVQYIIYVNEYLEKGFDVPFYDVYDATYNKNLRDRSRGEAYGLRAWYQWQLLKNFGGPSSIDPSVMLGIPIIRGIVTIEDANKIARVSYAESMEAINADIDSAYALIPTMRYNGPSVLNDDKNIGRISREMLLAMKARMYLYAASEAYKQVTWEEAATMIYASIDSIDFGLKKFLKPHGNYNDMVNGDHFWRSSYKNSGNLEKNYFPPSMYGAGRCNPSQNLIDVFPTAQGYPIDHEWAILFQYYKPDQPYEGRDPRFEDMIFYNGKNSSFRDVTVQTYDGGIDANGGRLNIATRTGYYMKKFLSRNVDLTPKKSGVKTSDFKFNVYFSRGALYLDYAEAALEAYGLAGKGPGMNISALDVIKEVRLRGGIASDDYLNFIAAYDLEKLKELVRIERRIELAFEGERYYDVRRWKLPLEELNKPVRGIKITNNGGIMEYNDSVIVEKRVFTENMYYNPIPRAEVLKSEALIQNAGWE